MSQEQSKSVSASLCKWWSRAQRSNGLYEVTSTTGRNIADMANDVLLCPDLPMSQLRGQTYDGAAAMAGLAQEVQAVPKRHREDRAAPCNVCALWTTPCQFRNTINMHGLASSNRCFELRAQIGCLIQTTREKDITVSVTGGCTSLKPLCPTRWTVWTPAVCAVLTDLEEIGSCAVEPASTTNGLLISRASRGKRSFLWSDGFCDWPLSWVHYPGSTGPTDSACHAESEPQIQPSFGGAQNILRNNARSQMPFQASWNLAEDCTCCAYIICRGRKYVSEELCVMSRIPMHGLQCIG